jgi:hypothetical protein
MKKDIPKKVVLMCDRCGSEEISEQETICIGRHVIRLRTARAEYGHGTTVGTPFDLCVPCTAQFKLWMAHPELTLAE